MVHRYHVCAVALLCALLGLVVLPPSGVVFGAPSYQTCSNVILNGGFETSGNWALGPGPLPPLVVSAPVYSGSFAMQMGSPAPTAQVANSWIYQRITIPNNAVSADLSFWVWLQSAAGAGTDVQQALLMIPGSTDLSLPFQVLWSTQANAPAWQKVPVSLLSQKGRTLDLYFNVYNDGAGGSTAMVLDDVALTICQPSPSPSPLPSATPFPTLTPTPFPTPLPLPSVTPSPSPGSTPFPTPAGSSTPIPPNCIELIRNGGFEVNGDWVFGQDPLLPFYNGNAAFVHSGARSMAQGAVNQVAVTVPAYSSIRQDVTLPSWAQTASITFWYYPLSNAASGGLSRQELILLDPLAYDETVKVLWRVTENGQQWLVSPTIDLTEYLGRTLSVYFNARNAGDGTWTGMYLDDVSLVACGGAAAMPLIETGGATFAATPGMMPAPLATLLLVEGPTIIAVSPVATTEAMTPTSSGEDTNEEPRRASRSFLDELGARLDTRTILIGIGVVALLIVVGVVLWRRRRENRVPASEQSTIDSTPEP